MTDSTIVALDEALAGTEPLTEDEVARSLRIVQRRAWDVAREYSTMPRILADAEAEAARAYLEAHARSVIEHPDRRVGEHENAAKLAALDAENEAVYLRLRERALRKEMELLDKLLSTLQTQSASFRVAA